MALMAALLDLLTLHQLVIRSSINRMQLLEMIMKVLAKSYFLKGKMRAVLEKLLLQKRMRFTNQTPNFCYMLSLDVLFLQAVVSFVNSKEIMSLSQMP